jgi:hypothetical protein
VAAYAIALLLVAFAAVASTALGISAGAFQLRWDADGGLASSNRIVLLVTENFGLAWLLLSFAVLPLIPLVDLGEELGWRDYLVLRLLPVGTVPALLISRPSAFSRLRFALWKPAELVWAVVSVTRTGSRFRGRAIALTRA